MSVFVAAAFAFFGFTEAFPVAIPENEFKFPITFENGKIGVNFLGFHASAGLGGLLTGNAADGGLQAEAGTPFGQRAWAGLGGGLSEGRSAGGLYAGATAGGGIGAKAGIGGKVGPDGSMGTSYAGASAGGLYKGKVKTIGHPPPVPQDIMPPPLGAEAVGEKSDGRSAGGLYAGATAGGGIGAKAGIGGKVGPDGSMGTSYAGASAGGLYKGKVITTGHPPPVPQDIMPPPLGAEAVGEKSDGDNSNIQVITKKEQLEKSANPPNIAKVDEKSLPVFNLDVSTNGIGLPPPPPPPLPPMFPTYVQKIKYKHRRRPFFRKYVAVLPPFPQVPFIVPGGSSPIDHSSLVITDKIKEPQVPVATLNSAADIVGSLTKGFGGSAKITKSLDIDINNPDPLGILSESSKLIQSNSKLPSIDLAISNT